MWRRTGRNDAVDGDMQIFGMCTQKKTDRQPDWSRREDETENNKRKIIFLTVQREKCETGDWLRERWQ